jgi:hypothetical protein
MSFAADGVSSSIKFGTGSGVTERMRITPAGNVGIGTSSPGGLLDINSSTGNDRLLLSYSGSVKCAFGVTTGGVAYMYHHTSATFPMYIGTTGNFGINNSSPAQKLDVTGSGLFSSSVTASGFFNSSDIRLKELVDITYDPLGITLITYKWKDGSDDKNHVGYSAQQVQEHMPDAVSENQEGFLSVDYIQVLVAKVAALEERIKELEDK